MYCSRVFSVAWKDAPGTRATEGSVTYTCDTQDGPRIASAFAHTALDAKSGLWLVSPISVIATPDQSAFAHNLVQHMVDSWQKNPQWERRQEEITRMGLQQIQAGFAQFMQQMREYHVARTAAMNQQIAGFQARQNSQARQVSSWGDTLTGLQNVVDPVTGSQFQVFAGPKSNYYVNGGGVKINSDVSPGPEFHQLTEVPQ